ncbi:MAG: magnesium transporter [Gemmatimonadales bacterium]|nr:magnesium transporter [Gemmatimonadales bacterium]
MTLRSPAIEKLVHLARDRELGPFIELARHVEPADLADVLAALADGERLRVVRALPPELSAEALVEIDPSITTEMMVALPPSTAAGIVEELSDDDAADVIGELEPEQQEAILREVEDRADVERLLSYDEKSAGGLMTTEVVAVGDGLSAVEAIDAVRRMADEVGDFYTVFVTDDQGRLVGELALKDLVLAAPARPVREIMTPPIGTVSPEEDQEEVARTLQRYNVPALAVTDPQGRLLGRITFDDVADVIEEEATEDILRFGGTSGDEELGARWEDAVRSRLPWLCVNLLTAFVAGAVVLAFQDVVSRIVVLSAWMPIIAGMGGNAGTQALAVTVRRLALGLIPAGQAVRVVTKEALVGVINGLANGIITALAAVALGQGWKLGVVVFMAMTGNLLVAGLAGAFIPIILEKFDVDPAIASSIFVTTFTDVCGFGLLLGLSSALLL